MKEIRTIKRSFTQDETLGSLPRDARLLFVGLICIVDDHGRFRAHPSLVRSSVFPYDDDLSAANCGELLRALQAAGRIVLWDQDGQTYGEIVNWSKHQRVDNAARSDLPERPPSANCGELPQPAANGGDPALERRGKDRKGTTPLPPTNGTVVDLPKRSRADLTVGERESFERWYKEYPKKAGKIAAEKAWKTALGRTNPEEITKGLRRQLPELLKKEVQFRPDPATWLNSGRWEDEVGAPGCKTARVLRCPTCRADAPEFGPCPGGETEATKDDCGIWRWVFGDEVHRVQNGHGA